MKVYVDGELPKSCEKCPFYKLDTYVDVYGYQINSHECVLDGSMMTGNCPLQSLADYTKQVRKEVCEEIRSQVEMKADFIDLDYCYGKRMLGILDLIEPKVIFDILNRIQGEN